LADFNQAIAIVLMHERGYVDHPDDPGGETNYGISKERYPDIDIPNLTKEDAKALYYRDYWLANNLNLVRNQQIANFALDTVVNHGQGGALIQKALNRSGQNVAVDNAIGNQTVNALNSVNPTTFLRAGVQVRREYYDYLISQNPRLAKFRTGWFRRVGFFLLNLKTVGIGALIIGIALIWYISRRRSQR